MAQLLALLLLLQAVPPERRSEKPIDDTYALSVLSRLVPGTDTLRLVIQDRSDRNRFWELSKLNPNYTYEFVRVDRNSVVLRSADDYGIGTYIKVFFDLPSKRLLKRTDYSETGFFQVSDSEAQRVLGVPAEFVSRLKAAPEPISLPRELFMAPLPQSTSAEFAKARPARVRDGYREGVTIDETIEQYQIVGNKIWFGKRFYDGEGTTGVGAIGYFDRTAKQYTFPRIPEIVDWSVSSLLVEGDTLWAGLVRHPEGANQPGGFIRHDLKSGVTRKYPVDDVVFRIDRWRDGLYLTTSNGIYILKGDSFTRYRVEPDINGKPIIISEQL